MRNSLVLDEELEKDKLAKNEDEQRRMAIAHSSLFILNSSSNAASRYI
jgi:hypothetical protein